MKYDMVTHSAKEGRQNQQWGWGLQAQQGEGEGGKGGWAKFEKGGLANIVRSLQNKGSRPL